VRLIKTEAVMPSTKLTKCIVAPYRISRILEWNKSKGSVMALDIGHKRVGIALTGHSSKSGAIFQYVPIDYREGKNRNKNKDFILREVDRIIENNQVCAFVVSWPVKPNGKVGKSCGRVLHVLDHLANNTKPLLSQNRPFSLWEEEVPVDRKDLVDKWGRSELFSRIPSIHQKIYSSKGMGDDIYNEGSSLTASSMLHDFMNTRCREDCQEEQYHINDPITNTVDATYFHGIGSSIDEHYLDDYESHGTYIQPSIL